MKITNYHHQTPVVRNAAYILMGIFAMFQIQDSLQTLLFLLIVLGIIDGLFNLGELMIENRIRPKWQIYINMLIDTVSVIFIVLLYIQSGSQHDDSAFHSPLLMISIGILFGIAVIFDFFRCVKLFWEKNILAYIVLVDLILTALMAVFLVYVFQVINKDVFFLFGIYAVSFGSINFILDRFSIVACKALQRQVI